MNITRLCTAIILFLIAIPGLCYITPPYVAHGRAKHRIHGKAKRQIQRHEESPYFIPTEYNFFEGIYLNPPKTSYENSLTGDWGGYRKKLADKGVSLSLTYTNNLLGNPVGGLDQGFAYTDSTGLNFSFDLQKLLSIPGLGFYTSFVQRNGTSLSSRYIGNLFPVSQIFGGENFRMDLMYFKQSLFHNKLHLSLGRLNAGDYFLQSPFYYAFVSNAYDGNPIGVFFNVPFSAYPNSQWAAYLYARLSDIFAWKAAAFNTNRSASENKFHGMNFSFHGDDGTMFITELDLLNNDRLCFISCRLPGRYTVGTMYLTGNDQMDLLTTQKVKGNYGFYYQLEQKWYQPDVNPLRGVSTFFVMEVFPERYNKIPLFFDTGVIYRGFIPSRPRDFLALGFVYGRFSRRLAEHERKAGMPVPTFEGNIEFNYRIYVAKWFFIQPDIQYIIHPDGFTHIPNAWVFGAQMNLVF